MMKILLSAYACEPDKGSEPGVGWHWALELAQRGHQVYVITRRSNKPAIETVLHTLPESWALHFIYVDLPSWCVAIKDAYRNLTYHGYYLLWQWVAFVVAKRYHRESPFDRVHHVTYVSIRQPSFMGLLGIPFYFGPVAGGETIPPALRKSFPLARQGRELLRDFVNAWVAVDPLMNLTFATATRIVVSSAQTQQLLPRRYRHKATVQLAIGMTVNSDRTPGSPAPEITFPPGSDRPFKILYVGHLLYLKGIHLALQALPLVLAACPQVQLTIIGKGEDDLWLKAMAIQLGLNNQVQWIDWMDQATLFQHYPQYDLFLFPSLRDSGGMVVLEAMAHGLPVVSFDLGGPGVIVNDHCGQVISAQNRSEQAIVGQLATTLNTLIQAQDTPEGLAHLHALKAGALARVTDFQWSRLVGQLYDSAEVMPQ